MSEFIPKKKLRKNASRYYSDGTVFREKDGLYKITSCSVRRVSNTRLGISFSTSTVYDYELEELSPDEVKIHEVMNT